MERNIKFRYYKLEQQHKEKNKWYSDGAFDFIAWLDKVENNNLLTTTVELNDTKARVEKIKYYEKNQLWVLRFMKLRDENIPTIAKENNEAEDIPLNDDEYIGEDVYVLYDECNKIAMVQSNRFSLGTERLAEYMNKILNNDNKMRVKMKPIMKEININKLKGKKYKTIELGFANIISDVPDSKSSLSSIMNTYRKFHGVSGHISISLGRTKGDTLNIVEIENLLNEVPEYDNIVSAKIRVKDDDSEHMEWVDLFDNLMQDVIPFHILKRSSIGFDYAANNMIDCYAKKTRRTNKFDFISEINGSVIMVERIRYYLERLYPYLISGFVLIIVHMWHIDFTDNTDLKEVLNGIVTLDSIILGFLGAIMPVILSMKNESKFVKYVFQKDKQHLFVKYLKITVLTGIVNAVISLSMHLRGNMSDNIRKVVYYSWIFTTLLFVILTYRCMSHMITLVFKTDEENEDGLERKRSTRVPKEREEDLKKHFK